MKDYHAFSRKILNVKSRNKCFKFFEPLVWGSSQFWQSQVFDNAWRGNKSLQGKSSSIKAWFLLVSMMFRVRRVVMRAAIWYQLSDKSGSPFKRAFMQTQVLWETHQDIYTIQDKRYKIQDKRYKIQDTRYKIQDTRNNIQDIYIICVNFQEGVWEIGSLQNSENQHWLLYYAGCTTYYLSINFHAISYKKTQKKGITSICSVPWTLDRSKPQIDILESWFEKKLVERRMSGRQLLQDDRDDDCFL